MSWPNTRASPGGLVDERGDDADQRGLAGAVGAEQREEIALLDVEVDALQRLDAVLVGLGESAYRECIHRRKGSGLAPASASGRHERAALRARRVAGQCLRRGIDARGVLRPRQLQRSSARLPLARSRAGSRPASWHDQPSRPRALLEYSAMSASAPRRSCEYSPPGLDGRHADAHRDVRAAWRSRRARCPARSRPCSTRPPTSVGVGTIGAEKNGDDLLAAVARHHVQRPALPGACGSRWRPAAGSDRPPGVRSGRCRP